MAEWTDVTLELSEHDRKEINHGIRSWGESSANLIFNDATEWLEADRFRRKHPILAKFKKGACVHDLKRRHIIWGIMVEMSMTITFLQDLYPDLNLFDMWKDEELTAYRNKLDLT